MIFMKIKNEYELKRELNETIYNFYSVLGLKTIVNHLEETEKNYEFDPATLAAEFDEYSTAVGSTLDLDDLINDYGYLLDDEDEDDEDEDTETWERVARAIEDNGRNTVLWIDSDVVNGVVIVK